MTLLFLTIAELQPLDDDTFIAIMRLLFQYIYIRWPRFTSAKPALTPA